MEKFRIIDDLTSDVMIEAYGKSLKELFENAALGMFSIICKADRVNASEEREVEAAGKNVKDLMINWLQELIAMVDIEEMFFAKFNIEEISEEYVKAKIYGEEVKPENGETVVKAVTYYGFDLEKNDGNYKVRFTLDI